MLLFLFFLNYHWQYRRLDHLTNFKEPLLRSKFLLGLAIIGPQNFNNVYLCFLLVHLVYNVHVV